MLVVFACNVVLSYILNEGHPEYYYTINQFD